MRLSPSLSPSCGHYFQGLVFVLFLQLLASFGSSPTTPLTELPSFDILPVASAWEWTDYVVGGNKDENSAGRRNTLSDAEISDLRVRDLKRRLARSHGYGADELSRMLDKKELIAALSKEERKLNTKYKNEQRRRLFWKGLLVALMCVVAIVGWPLWIQLSEATAVNWQVYYDRKRHEISQCLEFRSGKGAFGVTLLGFLDALRLWLSVTVLLSWVLSSDSPYRKYMFPIPSLPIRPGQILMGDKAANVPLGQYGINLAPMAITWSMGFVRGKIEYWTGKALAAAARHRRKEKRSGETKEERKARKATKKAAKRAAREEQERRQREAWEKEAERRKEMAQNASEQLFGRFSERDTRSDHSEPEEQNDSPISNNYNDAKREFEAEMEGSNDMDDLD